MYLETDKCNFIEKVFHFHVCSFVFKWNDTVKYFFTRHTEALD